MKNRIREFRVIKGLSQETLGKSLNTTKATISRLEKGIMPLTQNWMEKIAAKLDRSPHELIMNEGETKIQSLQPEREKTLLPYLNKHDLIPLYGPASAGSDHIYLTEEYVIGEELRPPALQGVKGGFMMLVAGDSMEPRMFRGGKLWVHPYQKPIPTDDCIVVMKEDGNALVKEYIGETATEIKLLQLNPRKNLAIKKVDIEKVFLVIGIQRR